MVPSWLKSLLDIMPLIQPILTFAAAYFAARVALRRFQSERWWEKKFSTYESIIAALHQMSESLWDEIEADRRSSDSGERVDISQITEKYRAADEDISRALGFGEFIISAEVIAELRRMRRELANVHEGGYSTELFESAKAVNECTVNIRRLARDDLREGAWRPFLRRIWRSIAGAKQILRRS
jgi:hypothetical protein